MPTPEETAAAEAAKAQQDEAAKIAAEAKTKADAEAAAKVAEEEVFDKDRAMKTINTLREIETQAKKDKKELERLQKADEDRKNAELTESERLKKENDKITAENAKIKSDLLRRDVIAEVGLPATFADRLKGETKEELLADAQELAKTIPQVKTAPRLNNTNPSQANANETKEQQRERLFGPSTSQMFDLEAINKNGGGVIFGGEPKKEMTIGEY